MGKVEDAQPAEPLQAFDHSDTVACQVEGCQVAQGLQALNARDGVGRQVEVPEPMQLR